MEPNVSVKQLIDEHFNAYNAARLREGAKLWAERMCAPDAMVTLTLTGALTPAGLGLSCIIPLIRAGFVDCIISTGANVYHDAHFALGFNLHRFTPHADDVALHEQGLVRIYDVVMEYEVLLKTDAFFYSILESKEFSKTMGSAEFHYHVGKFLAERQRKLNLGDVSLLAVCYEMDVPVYTSSPGDSGIGMNAALGSLTGKTRFTWDVSLDVNETSALVYLAKKERGKTGVVILGGGSPKNFFLQTQPYIQEILGIEESGHDYFLQITDARPDTGGLSGATPSEAVSWGKINPNGLPNTVVCYTDSTIALPLLTAYLFSAQKPKEPKRLYKVRQTAVEELKQAHYKTLKSRTPDSNAR